MNNTTKILNHFVESSRREKIKEHNLKLIKSVECTLQYLVKFVNIKEGDICSDSGSIKHFCKKKT